MSVKVNGGHETRLWWMCLHKNKQAWIFSFIFGTLYRPREIHFRKEAQNYWQKFIWYRSKHADEDRPHTCIHPSWKRPLLSCDSNISSSFMVWHCHYHANSKQDASLKIDEWISLKRIYTDWALSIKSASHDHRQVTDILAVIKLTWNVRMENFYLINFSFR